MATQGTRTHTFPISDMDNLHKELQAWCAFEAQTVTVLSVTCKGYTEGYSPTATFELTCLIP